MRRIIVQSLRALFVLTLLTGVAYPIAITLLAQSFFAGKANGSLVEKDGKLVGSLLLGQEFKGANYFWPRPSASDYNTLPGAASNLGPTNSHLKDQVKERLARYGLDAESKLKPYDLLLSSGSGLDPHISPESAFFQAPRVAQSRKLDPVLIRELIERTTETSLWGLIGKARVNVLKLNLALDQLGR